MGVGGPIIPYYPYGVAVDAWGASPYNRVSMQALDRKVQRKLEPKIQANGFADRQPAEYLIFAKGKSRGSSVECPKCSGTLQPVVQDNIEVDRCVQCGGLWFDM